MSYTSTDVNLTSSCPIFAFFEGGAALRDLNLTKANSRSIHWIVSNYSCNCDHPRLAAFGLASDLLVAIIENSCFDCCSFQLLLISVYKSKICF